MLYKSSIATPGCQGRIALQQPTNLSQKRAVAPKIIQSQRYARLRPAETRSRCTLPRMPAFAPKHTLQPPGRTPRRGRRPVTARPTAAFRAVGEAVTLSVRRRGRCAASGEVHPAPQGVTASVSTPRPIAPAEATGRPRPGQRPNSSRTARPLPSPCDGEGGAPHRVRFTQRRKESLRPFRPPGPSPPPRPQAGHGQANGPIRAVPRDRYPLRATERAVRRIG